MDITFDLTEISNNADYMMPYIDYVASVINLYAHMCLSRNHIAIKRVKDTGINYDHIICSLTNRSLHDKLKAAYLFLARVIFIDNDPFPTLQAYKNRCYL